MVDLETDGRKYALVDVPNGNGARGYIIEKIVKRYPFTEKVVPTSGVFFVPKRFINATFLMIMIPEKYIGKYRDLIDDEMMVWRLEK